MGFLGAQDDMLQITVISTLVIYSRDYLFKTSDMLVCSENSTRAQTIKYFEHTLNSEIKIEFDPLASITQTKVNVIIGNTLN